MKTVPRDRKSPLSARAVRRFVNASYRACSRRKACIPFVVSRGRKGVGCPPAEVPNREFRVKELQGGRRHERYICGHDREKVRGLVYWAQRPADCGWFGGHRGTAIGRNRRERIRGLGAPFQRGDPSGVCV